MHTAYVVVTYLLWGLLFAEGWIRIRDRVADWLWGIQQGIDVDELDRPTKGSGDL